MRNLRQLSDLREKVADLLCPYCEAPVSERIFAYDDMDPNQADVETFECGYVSGGHHPQACPHDPAFPALTDYELRCEAAGADTWFCFAVPKTVAAKHHYLGGTDGPTEREARSRLIERYNWGAPPEKRAQLES